MVAAQPEETQCDDEGDLNSPEDCFAYIEHYFPAKEADYLGIDVEAIGNFLRQASAEADAKGAIIRPLEEILPEALNAKNRRLNKMASSVR